MAQEWNNNEQETTLTASRRIDKCPIPGQRFSDKSPPSGPTRRQMPDKCLGGGWARLELKKLMYDRQLLA